MILVDQISITAIKAITANSKLAYLFVRSVAVGLKIADLAVCFDLGLYRL